MSMKAEVVVLRTVYFLRLDKLGEKLHVASRRLSNQHHRNLSLHHDSYTWITVINPDHSAIVTADHTVVLPLLNCAR